MENRELPEKNRLEELEDVIKNASLAIDEEFNRTANPWLSCFGSCVFQVETYLGSPKTKSLILPEKYQLAEQRLENLKQKLYDLKKIYPEKNNIPPAETQQELLHELNVLRKDE
jgi:hypothetical protein